MNGTLLHVEGNLKALENLKFEGYEIHMGKTELLEGCPMNQSSRYGEEKGQTDSGYGAGKQNREQYTTESRMEMYTEHTSTAFLIRRKLYRRS